MSPKRPKHAKNALPTSDFARDRRLGIQSCGIREWSEFTTDYNRCEPTPYRALDDLFEHYHGLPNPHLVDYGCGRGRVLFYCHQRWGWRGTGVECHEDTLIEALENLERYRHKRQRRGRVLQDEIGFEACPAEHRPVHKDENIFYFFNPFSVAIFQQVLDQIHWSLAEHERPIDLLLYYPLNSYRQALRLDRHFDLAWELPLDWGEEARYDRFLLYQHRPACGS